MSVVTAILLFGEQARKHRDLDLAINAEDSSPSERCLVLLG